MSATPNMTEVSILKEGVLWGGKSDEISLLPQKTFKRYRAMGVHKFVFLRITINNNKIQTNKVLEALNFAWDSAAPNHSLF